MAIYGCIDKCVGCRHQTHCYDTSDSVCDMYMRPYSKWGKLGGCESATHVKREVVEQAKQRVGQQKQKKR